MTTRILLARQEAITTYWMHSPWSKLYEAASANECSLGTARKFYPFQMYGLSFRKEQAAHALKLWPDADWKELKIKTGIGENTFRRVHKILLSKHFAGEKIGNRAARCTQDKKAKSSGIRLEMPLGTSTGKRRATTPIAAQTLADEAQTLADEIIALVENVDQEEVKTEPGAKYDHGKAAYDLIAPELLDSVGEVLAYGAEKYGRRNWEKGMSWTRPFNAMMRHMWAWLRGERDDPESGLSHLGHAACCLMFLMAFEKREVGTDDRSE